MPNVDQRTMEFRKKVAVAYPALRVSVRTVNFEGLGYEKARFVTVHGDYNLDAFYQIRTWCREAGLILQQPTVAEFTFEGGEKYGQY